MSYNDTTLWSIAFSGRGRSRSGSFNERNRDQGSPSTATQVLSLLDNPQFALNGTGMYICTFRNCKFLHKCSYCIMDPRAVTASHKATNCPFQPHPDYHLLPLPQDKHPIRNSNNQLISSTSSQQSSSPDYVIL